MTNSSSMGELRKAIINYRIKCDMALSEVKDGVYTQKEYEKAIECELDRVLSYITSQVSEQVTSARLSEVANITRILDEKHNPGLIAMELDKRVIELAGVDHNHCQACLNVKADKCCICKATLHKSNIGDSKNG